MKKIISSLFVSTWLIFNWFNVSFAEDRALLIGVGQYQFEQVYDLPGIPVDIEMMKDTAKRLGFDEKQIKTLVNEQATLSNVKSTINDWLIQGTTKDDRVLIYYTGHGSRIIDENGDELDGADEVLVLYDAQVVKRAKKTTLVNVLADDELNVLLNQIQSQDLLLLVDACNSGTVYKNFDINSHNSQHKNQIKAKFFNYEGLPVSKKSSIFDEADLKSSILTKNKDSRFLAITAAADDELALATSHGSLFTLGINTLLQQAVAQDVKLTPNELVKQLSSYIRNKVLQDNLGPVHHPQLAGDKQLANKTLEALSVTKFKPNWDKLLVLLNQKESLSFNVGKHYYMIDEEVSISVEVPQSGYLNVINVDPYDRATLLFPNAYHQNNYVEQGYVSLPQIVAAEPKGKTLTIAILTEQPINLLADAIETKSADIENNVMFVDVSAKGFVDLKNAKVAGSYYHTGKILLQIK